MLLFPLIFISVSKNVVATHLKNNCKAECAALNKRCMSIIGPFKSSVSEAWVSEFLPEKIDVKTLLPQEKKSSLSHEWAVEAAGNSISLYSPMSKKSIKIDSRSHVADCYERFKKCFDQCE